MVINEEDDRTQAWQELSRALWELQQDSTSFSDPNIAAPGRIGKKTTAGRTTVPEEVLAREETLARSSSTIFVFNTVFFRTHFSIIRNNTVLKTTANHFSTTTFLSPIAPGFWRADMANPRITTDRQKPFLPERREHDDWWCGRRFTIKLWQHSFICGKRKTW